MNSGSWNIAVTGGTVTATGSFDAGDRLAFNFSIGDPEFNGYLFGGALAAGGGSFGGTRDSVSFTATAGTGTLRLTSNTPVAVPGGSARPIAVVRASCIPAVASAPVPAPGPAPAGTSVVLSASPSPSTAGQITTLTATVAGASPTGSVTFRNRGIDLATVALSGGAAALSVASLPVGAHVITAHYGGDAGNAPSVSAPLNHSVTTPPGSASLRNVQIGISPIAARLSSQAIFDAVGSAIGNSFRENPLRVQRIGSGMRFSFRPEGGAHVALSDAHTHSDERTVGDASGSEDRSAISQSAWLAWTQVRGFSFDRRSSGSDLDGDQVNGIAGLSLRTSVDVVAGLLAGYERFDYSSQALSGRLKGDGWTAGAYVGWRLAPQWDLEAAVARSTMDFDSTSGTAAGAFSGSRWLISAGARGTYIFKPRWAEVVARIDALREREHAYTDNQNTRHAQRNFTAGRASSGGRLGIDSMGSVATIVRPYFGIYGDYYFSNDDESPLGVGSVPITHGWAARFTSGLGVQFGRSASMEIGAEYSRFEGSTRIWSVKAILSWPL